MTEIIKILTMNPRILDCNSGVLLDRPRSRDSLRQGNKLNISGRPSQEGAFLRDGLSVRSGLSRIPLPQYRSSYVFIEASILYAPFVVTAYFPCTYGN
jgi:hypothetical protein